MAEPIGSALVTLQVSGRWALTLLTAGWSDEEKQALLNGDAEARDALRGEATLMALDHPTDVEDLDFQVWISEKSGEAA
jgi:hypothetical protein